MTTLERGITHPQIHLDYYEWLNSLQLKDGETDEFKKFNAKFAKDLIARVGGLENFHAVAMWAWGRSREILAQKAKEEKEQIHPFEFVLKNGPVEGCYCVMCDSRRAAKM